ncbi:2-phospho-L-lactate guanylyltransferase [Microbacterium sp. BG28]|uniref:2-phospho-L-lactate guanylyltransferase n=1 Tax=Microbacterium sp. BG28 TaxID=3097356 RepID=UPI002A5AA516|nr:2-phospho-L-lactate guanylyltransferase [Microbacterium sp. BG28]MDY0829901.1 2-phospho-L-lactate guanylyltransferase [Microbacterium sp. BG28]
MSLDWTVVVPLKAAASGKSRLGASADLVRAIGLDTVAAAAEAARVVVVTADPQTAADAAAIDRVTVVTEEEPRGLNAAIALGMRATDGPRAALLGDLPALRPDDLSRALDAAASVDRAVVADAEGTGSTLVTARAGVAWESAFGADSLARHLALGCVRLDVPEHSSLRRDVDTMAQLVEAAALGLGPRSVRFSTGSSLSQGGPRREA